MDVGLFLEGMIIGFAIAAPVGPIGVLCIRRTLAEGRISGLVSGLGAATADAVYGSVAALGLTFITEFLVGGEAWLRLVGGVFLLFLGSAAWWLVLSGATGLFRTRLSAVGLRWVNRVSGTVIAAFGVLAVSGLGG
ncbi:MAG: LysE family transporter [Actinobacteria bacterium]|nr:LysE family transporter [Actinomycetota bacterium]